ncbi:hypothetical protein ACIGCM_06280 [Pseudomonas sp. NPDC078700]|uniref:hypothetical protein n=1 Tax=Pseudomonas sp. NPDC078700 TaxID=3364424 RepID=UPI0037CBE3DF
MDNLPPQKTGVISVKGVIETLEPSNDGASSKTTQSPKEPYTNSDIHQWCNSSDPEPLPLTSPEGKVLSGHKLHLVADTLDDTGTQGQSSDEHDEWIFVAGMYLDPTLVNLEDFELHLVKLPVHDELAFTIASSIDLMRAALAFWWQDYDCVYHERTREVCRKVWEKLDSIIQTAEFSDQDAIASTVRNACGYYDTELSDSLLLASYALLLAMEGLNELYGWQNSLADALTMDLRDRMLITPTERNLRFEAIRFEQRYIETDARLTHAEYMSKASELLFIAAAHKKIESLDSAASGYRFTDKQQAAIKAPLIKNASKGGTKGGATKKSEAAEDALKTCNAARKIRQSEPEISYSDLVTRLIESLGRSAPTVRKQLRTEGLYPAAKKEE